MQTPRLKGILEAILFVRGDPVATDDIAHALGVTALEIAAAAEALRADCDQSERGVRLHMNGGHLQLRTREEYAPYIVSLLQPVQRQTLSQAALETLSVVAYRQPVTKAEVEMVRGVRCDYAMQSLAGKGLIREVGRKETLGRPILYGTTDDFLARFGLESVHDLPPLKQAEEGEQDAGTIVP